MSDKLKVGLSSTPSMSIQLQGAQTQSISLDNSIQVGARNYDNLTNKPQINGTTLSGNKTPYDIGLISENTTAGWAENPTYVPRRGEICLYTDTQYVKIGDGEVPVVDLPYIESSYVGELEDRLDTHVNNMAKHVSSADRTFWDNKLNYRVQDETLILNRN